MSNSDVIQQIKDKADIVELVSDHVVLKRSGANYLGLCPFHKDSKPSMHVSPSKGIFKCFSCGEGGDVFKFWSEFHKKDFKETLKDLAQKYGIQLHYSPEDQERAKLQNKKLRMHELAAKYYTDKLLRADNARHCREYLDDRSITTATIEKFKLGYSPNEPGNKQRLINYLKSEMSVTDTEIADAGLAIQKEGSAAFDRFRGRLMIPIFNEQSKVIAFGARTLKDPQTGEEQNPKYLNSPETSTYHKGNNLYALNFAKEFIRKEDSVIVVEGYFDVIAAHQAGIENVVANQGTALTTQQAKLLAKFSDSKKIFLCFDTDRAGEQATERGVETILEATQGLNVELRIMRVPSGKDPDELIRFGGNERFLKLIEEAPALVDYQLNKILTDIDMNSPKSKGEGVNKIGSLLANVENQIERSEYLRTAGEKLNVDPTALKDQINTAIRRSKAENFKDPYRALKGPNANQDNNKESKPSKKFKRVNGHILYIDDSISSTESEIIVMSICDKVILEEFMATEKRLINESSQTILEAVADVTFENPELKDPLNKYQMICDKLVAFPEYSNYLADIGIAIDHEINKADIHERFKDTIRKLDAYFFNKKIEEIIKQIKEVEDKESAGEDCGEQWNTLQKQKQEFVAKLQETKKFKPVLSR